MKTPQAGRKKTNVKGGHRVKFETNSLAWTDYNDILGQQRVVFDVVAIPADDNSCTSQRYLISLHGIAIPDPNAYAKIFDRAAGHCDRRAQANPYAGGDSWRRGLSSHTIV